MKWNTDWLKNHSTSRGRPKRQRGTHATDKFEQGLSRHDGEAPQMSKLRKKREDESKLLREMKLREAKLEKRVLEEHDNARRFIATLEHYDKHEDEIAMLARGLIDLDVTALAQELDCKSLPVEARWLLIKKTNEVVARANKRAYGYELDDEIPWLVPRKFMTTLDELKIELNLR